jgi:monoamine oxidase
VTDPFSCGGYSYDVVNGKEIKQIIKQPIDNTIFFAGEGLYDGPEIGTVEAALYSGRETAHQIIAGFKK